MGLFDRFTRKAIGPQQAQASAIRALMEKEESIGLDNSEISLINRVRELEKVFTDIDKGIDEITGTDYRIMTITDWLNAIRSADVPWNGKYQSSWVQLFDIFQNMSQDAHVQGAVNILVEGITSKEFFIANENGEKNDEATKLFKNEWFFDFLEMVVNSGLWGFNLIQLRNIDFSDFSLEVEEINRKHVRPDLGGITKATYDSVAWREWDEKPYSDWTIYIFRNVLGQFNACVRWWIYKTEVARFWAKYNQMYGTPPVIVQTAIKDVKRKDNAITMVKNFITSRWMVTDKEDEIVQFDTKGGANGQQFFENLIRLCDQQISKALLSATMTMEDGSSKSQAEVHEDTVNKSIKSYARLAQFSINKELIPRLQNFGFPLPKGAQFVWDNSEKMTMEKKAEIVDTMNKSYKVPLDTASEFVGIELEEKAEEPFDPKFTPPGNGE